MGVAGSGKVFENNIKTRRQSIGHIAHTHNMYVELFAQTGLLGLGTFLWLLCHTFSKTLGSASRLDGANRVFAARHRSGLDRVCRNRPRRCPFLSPRNSHLVFYSLGSKSYSHPTVPNTPRN